jgi:hypothetical protein
MGHASVIAIHGHVAVTPPGGHIENGIKERHQESDRTAFTVSR